MIGKSLKSHLFEEAYRSMYVSCNYIVFCDVVFLYFVCIIVLRVGIKAVKGYMSWQMEVMTGMTTFFHTAQGSSSSRSP